ncbi:hypothetical protein D3C74_461170 [compost metagenome]
MYQGEEVEECSCNHMAHAGKVPSSFWLNCTSICGRAKMELAKITGITLAIFSFSGM